MDVLLATDADWIIADVTAALGGPDVRFTVIRDGRLVSKHVHDNPPDLVICDLQIGTMGGMAVTMDLRLDESSGYLPHIPTLMLLDREADVFLARRSGASGWLRKPLNPLRLKQAQRALLEGHAYHDGEVVLPPADEPAESATPEEEPATAG